MIHSAAMQIETRPIADLLPYPNNAKIHSDEQITKIAASIKEFGFNNPVLIDQDGGIIAGHGRIEAARKLNMNDAPTITLAHLSEAQKKAYILADNRLAEIGSEWDMELVAIELDSLDDFIIDLLDFDDISVDLFHGYEDGQTGISMAERYMVPPFSVFNSREGWWTTRKKSWLSLGIESEKGRKPDALGYKNSPASLGKLDTSTFDPTLSEIIYRWFCPTNGLILDPFAGGSVRGIVANYLGYKYHGNDLSETQIKANRIQAENILPDNKPVWTSGDSINIKELQDVSADFIFTCPPYADLEVYSDDSRDLSNMDYKDFIIQYRKIIKNTCELLKDDSFACIVVGEVRASDGNYYNFVGDTVNAFIDAGLNYYNEAVLLTSIGSLPIRAGRTFTASRKLGKTHQNVLVFVKGSWKVAASKCPELDLYLGDTEV